MTLFKKKKKRKEGFNAPIMCSEPISTASGQTMLSGDGGGG